jgi:hypothetical protein
VNGEANWKLDDELKKLADANSAEGALRKLGLLGFDEDEFDLVSAPEGWYRSGGETYLYRFRVLTRKSETCVVLKACVAWAPATTLEAIFLGWLERRQLLASRGVLTPRLYAWGQAVVLEEDVPFELTEILKRAEVPSDSLLLSMADLAGVVASLGFLPVGLFEDLRSHGEDVVAVDFGTDLGPPYVAKDQNPQVFDQLLAHLSNLGARVPDVTRGRMRAVFEAQWHLKAQ